MQIPLIRDVPLSPQERELIATADAFAQRHFATEKEATDHLPYRQLLTLACQAGLAGTEVATDLGGSGASFAARVQLCETLARYNAGFAFSLVNHHNVIARIARQGSPQAKERWIKTMLAGTQIGCTAMTEPQSGSDFTSMRTMAKRSGEGWVINGAKTWITNTAYADLFLVYAQTDPAAGAKGIAGFLVDANEPGFERGDIYQGFGTEGIGAGGFQLRDHYVGPEFVLYPPGQGFLSAMQGVNEARTYVAAISAAMVDAALHTACEYTGSRYAFGQPLLDLQGLGWSLATVATHLQAMYSLVDAGVHTIAQQRDAQYIAAMAKKYANNHAGPAITACMQSMGAQGLLPEYRLARLLAWAQVFCYTDGSAEMMNERVVHMLRKACRAETGEPRKSTD